MSQSVDLPSFNGIDQHTGATIELQNGDTQSVTLSGNESQFENLQLNVAGEILTLTTVNGFNKKVDGVVVTIVSPGLNSFTSSGSGNMEGAFCVEGDCSISISGSSNITLILDGGNLNTQLKGSGNITLSGRNEGHSLTIPGSGEVYAFDLASVTLDVNVSGSGNSQVNVSGSITGKISGSGDVTYQGSPTVNVSTTGSGKVIKA